MKIVFISTMLPSGHYSQIICGGLAKQKDIDLIVYADKNSENLKIRGCGEIRNVWSKSPKYISDILSQLRIDRPAVVHLQHELNMYGSLTTAIMFPILVALIRLSGYKVVTTVHAAVYKNQINTDFLMMFHQNSTFVRPFMLKIIFEYLFRSISLFSHSIILHTKLSESILVKDYGLDKSKARVIPDAIPVKKIYWGKKEKYFFYFGYMVRRKGLGFALEGFSKFFKKYPKSPFKFILAGGKIKGQESAYDEIISPIKKLNLSTRVVVKGFINEKEQDKLYHKAYAVIIPAVLSMGSSGPLYHANSYGKCVIATREGHFIEDIKNQSTGILTSNRHWDKAIAFAIDHPDMIEGIEKNVIEKAKTRSPMITANRYFKIYQSL